jgi:hypothetical protein
MNTLKNLLDFRELTASYMAAPTIGDFPFTSEFYQSPRDAISDDIEMIYFPAANVPAPISARGAAARVLQLAGATKRFASLFVAFNQIGLPADSLTGLRYPDVYELQEKGRQTVETQLEFFRQRHALMKEAAFANQFATGVVCWDAGGNILPATVNYDGSVSQPSNTVMADFGLADNQRGLLDDTTDGGTLIEQLWTNSACLISYQLDKLVQRSARKNRTKPTEVWINGINKRHLRSNTEFRTWAQYHQRSIDEVLRGSMINDLWGFNWHFVDGTYTDVNGTSRDLIPVSSAIIAPKPGPWMRAYRGAINVPKNLNVVGSFEEVLNSYEIVYGQAAWAKMTDNPVSLEMFMSDAFGINFADPGCIYCPSVFEVTGASGTNVSNN